MVIYSGHLQCQWSFTVVIYSASGHVQKFAADSSLSTFQNSRPYKIFTLSLNSNQNLHTSAPYEFPLFKLVIKISFVLFNQEIVMQHFDLYNRSSILITISYLLKFLFREPRFHPSSLSSPLPLKTQDSRIFLLSHWLTSCSSPSRYPIQILLTL